MKQIRKLLFLSLTFTVHSIIFVLLQSSQNNPFINNQYTKHVIYAATLAPAVTPPAPAQSLVGGTSTSSCRGRCAQAGARVTPNGSYGTSVKWESDLQNPNKYKYSINYNWESFTGGQIGRFDTNISVTYAYVTCYCPEGTGQLSNGNRGCWSNCQWKDGTRADDFNNPPDSVKDTVRLVDRGAASVTRVSRNNLDNCGSVQTDLIPLSIRVSGGSWRCSTGPLTWSLYFTNKDCVSTTPKPSPTYTVTPSLTPTQVPVNLPYVRCEKKQMYNESNIIIPDGGSVYRGQRVKYRLDYRNVSNVVASNASIRDTLPGQVIFDRTDTGNCYKTPNGPENHITCELGTVPANTSGTVSFWVQIKNDAPYGKIFNDAIASPGDSNFGPAIYTPLRPANYTPQCPVTQEIVPIPTSVTSTPTYTPTPTTKSSPTPTNTTKSTPSPTPTPPIPNSCVIDIPIQKYYPVCQNIKIYKNSMVVVPSSLMPGDTIQIAVVNTSATKVRISINNEPYIETSEKNLSGEFVLTYTLKSNVTQYTIKAQVTRDGNVWY